MSKKQSGRYVTAKSHKRISKKSSGLHVKRDSTTGKFISARSDKNARVLAATVGGAVIGNIFAPGIGGAVVGAIAGALVGNSSDEDSDDE